MDKLKSWVLGLLLNKYAAGWMVQLWGAAEGYRTQLGLAGAAIALAMGFFGMMPWDKAMDSASLMGGAAIAAFLEKLRRHDDLVKKLQGMGKSGSEPKAE